MKLVEFLQTKEITLEELSKTFELEREFECNFNGKVCCNCEDELNHKLLSAPSWCEVQRCFSCDRIMFVIVQDRMAGIREDIIKVFKEEE